MNEEVPQRKGPRHNVKMFAKLLRKLLGCEHFITIKPDLFNVHLRDINQDEKEHTAKFAMNSLKRADFWWMPDLGNIFIQH